ncbi:hypothetical protein [Beijerinckia sp. L45]|uniref:hypothetical protein n=1 Tax=Beijerinckia sp. L45 TaxID=1641855 RepID=UPI00131C019E|nr:hypothetical protein [Beijerinckia sp. L45]
MRSALTIGFLVSLAGSTAAMAQATVYSTTPAPRSSVDGTVTPSHEGLGLAPNVGDSGGASALPGSPGTAGTTGTGSAGVGPTGTMASPGR